MPASGWFCCSYSNTTGGVMILTNTHDVGLSVAVWLASDFYNHNRFPGKKAISATGLLKPVRQTILAQRAFKSSKLKQSRDILDNIESHAGTAVHAGIEKAWKENYKQALLDLGKPKHLINRIIINPTPEQLAQADKPIPVYLEQRTYREFGDWIIHGEFDFIGDGILEDFKNVKIFGFMKKDNNKKYQLQGSIYRWLNPDKITKNFMRIQFLIKDWKKYEYESRKAKGYPPTPSASQDFVYLSLAETEKFIQNKIDLLDQYANASEDQIPHCPDDELWMTESVFKYYKNPAKTNRSTKNSSEYHELHTLMTQNGCGIIKEVKGVIKRCNPKWCAAFELCTQKDVYIAENRLDLD